MAETERETSGEWQRPRERCQESDRGTWGWWEKDVRTVAETERDAKIVAEN